MKKIIIAVILSLLGFTLGCAQTPKNKVILFIAEQNIEGPQKAWWASEVDLSATETTLAKKLIEQGYEIVEPSVLSKTIKERPAFRMLNIEQGDSVKLGKISQADFVVLGKAVASSGGGVPQSNMRSSFANITAKLIRVSDGKVIAYLDASGSSVHIDVITGGKEALVNAAEDLSGEIIEVLNKAKKGN